jgi:hypothetical protein
MKRAMPVFYAAALVVALSSAACDDGHCEAQ